MRALKGLAVVVLTIWCILLAWSSSGLAEPGRLMIRVGAAVFAAVMLTAAVVYATHRRPARLLTTMGTVLLVLAVLSVTPWLAGGLQNLLGSRCTGFFAERQSCVEDWKLVVFVALLNPIVFPLLVTVVPALLLVGVWRTVRPGTDDVDG